MTASIFDQLQHEHPDLYDPADGGSQPATTTTEGTTMSSNLSAGLTSTHEAITAGLDGLRTWAQNIQADLTTAASHAARLESSPIVQALDDLTAPLPAAVEQNIASLIRHYAAIAPQPGATFTAHAGHFDSGIELAAQPAPQ